MKIYRTTGGIVIAHDESFFLSKETDWDNFINRQNLFQQITKELKDLKADHYLSETIGKNLLAPVGSQEVWAAGVTYFRSREARMEEAKDAGGGDFYARVYDADRPELFFKVMRTTG